MVVSPKPTSWLVTALTSIMRGASGEPGFDPGACGDMATVRSKSLRLGPHYGPGRELNEGLSDNGW